MQSLLSLPGLHVPDSEHTYAITCGKDYRLIKAIVLPPFWSATWLSVILDLLSSSSYELSNKAVVCFSRVTYSYSGSGQPLILGREPLSSPDAQLATGLHRL
jgi:hypothetical protein